MFVIVGKARPNDQTGDVELYLGQFRQMYRTQGQFVYAWSFNPDERAIDMIQQHIDNKDDVFLYLPVDGRRSNLRMHIISFCHNRNGIGTCPAVWRPYCINELQGHQNWGVHLWFLIDAIDDLPQHVDLLNTFAPALTDKYQNWGQSYFAFLREV